MFTQAQNYQFYGDPVSQAASVAAHKAQMAAEGQIGAASQTAAGAVGAAKQNALGQLFSQPSNAYAAYAGSGANAFGNYAQGLGGVANAQAGLYGSYNQNLANLYGSQMSAMGQTETARQLGLANLGSAALSAGGQASGAAMGAWAQNQSAFAKAMSDANVANQQAMSQYGVGRESALAALGNSTANYGGSLANAQGQYGQNASQARGSMLGSLANTDLGGYNAANNYTRDMAKLGLARELGTGQLTVGSQTASTLPSAFGAMGNAMGNSLNLTADANPSASVSGSGGGISGGNYGGGYGGGNGGVSAPGPTQFGQGREWYQDQQAAPAWQSKTPAAVSAMDTLDDKILGGLAAGGRATYGGLDRLRGDITSSPILQQLVSQSNAGSGQLDSAYYSSRNMPSQMLGQSMSGFNSMMNTASRGLNAGMNQFYGNIPRDGAALMREALMKGSTDINATSGRLGSAYNSFNSANQQGYNTANSQLQDIMNRSGVVSPVEAQRLQFQVEDAAAARKAEQKRAYQAEREAAMTADRAMVSKLSPAQLRNLNSGGPRMLPRLF